MATSLVALRAALARDAPVSATQLASMLAVSVPTVHRLLAGLPPSERVAAGKARRARYGLRRPVRGALRDLPLYQVDRGGRADLLATLAPLQGQGSWCDLADTPWPLPPEARDGWWPGLPYPLNDMRPQGYMGRQFARAEHEALGVAPDPQAWTEDDVLHVLSQRGWDASGNLIVGDDAYRAWQAQAQRPAPVIGVDQTASAYAALAQHAVAAGVPGSSAAGEFPKFAARRAVPDGVPGDTPHVLVKFSGADASPAVRRWADLLVCEHLALRQLAGAQGPGAALSRIVQGAGRTFLEVERFDRHGERGRSALCSLETVNAALLGDPSRDWSHLASRLYGGGWLDAAGRDAITRLWWFGRLIGNTDMHLGNLSLRPDGGRLQAAPAYDMLPMLYAPLAGGEVPPRSFAPVLPLPTQRGAWHSACADALALWDAAADDDRISVAFRDICAANASALRAAAQHA